MSPNFLLAVLAGGCFVYVAHLLAEWGAATAKRLEKRAAEIVAGVLLLLTVTTVLVINWFPLLVPAAVWASPLCYLEQAAYAVPAAAFFGLAGARLADARQRHSVRLMGWIVAVTGALHLLLAVDARQHRGLVDVPFDGPVCRQSTDWSCGPAACATMLKARGVRATEREMGELCLTYWKRGTTLPRFVRGLTLKVERDGLPWEVMARRGMTVEDLDRFPMPCVVSVRWSLLVDHAVCVYGRDEEGRWRIGEVTAGVIQTWQPEEFRAKFKGEAITVIPTDR